MTDERMIAWLRSYAKLAVYLSDEERINAMADRIEALQAENAKLREALGQIAVESSDDWSQEVARKALQETER